MKTFLKLAAAILLSTFNLQPATSLAQGTAFTYQGRLNEGVSAANGRYDFTFTLFATNTDGNAIAGPVTNSAVVVSNGLFTALVDFGDAFTSTSNWLEIAVSTNGADSFSTLTPRQQLTPVPYAITAQRLATPLDANSLPANVVTNNAAGLTLSGAFAGDGSGLSSVNAYSVNGLTTDSLWKVGGNAGANPTNGAFLGTKDNLPLEFWVNTNRALRIEYALDPFSGAVAAPNIIGGFGGNVVSNGVAGAFIGGGGDLWWPNTVGGDFASILGGHGNMASSFHSICIGDNCIASAPWSIAMGVHAHALHEGAFVWADSSSPSFAGFDSTTNYQFLLRATGGVGIGTTTPPPGGLNVASGGLAVSGASSPNYHGAKGVFLENQNSYGAIFAFDYTNPAALPLCLNTPGGNVGIGLTAPVYKLDVNGSINARGTVYANGLALTSDRNAKENFTTVNAREVLAQVANLPMTQWNYKTDGKAVQHLGPMAQDFQAAFGLNGADDKHISVVDEGGVALAAIQGLNQKLEAIVKAKDAKIGELEQRLARLENIISANKQN
jgi:hypothetical protein